MPDISMCFGAKEIQGKKDICPLREKCYRYTAKPSEFRQSYILPDPFGEKCTHYWPNEERK